ncbi:hypothetical protein ABRT01_10135 [Lentibacillus sp. L22]|uniref:hypothetical protein n=1 Tax=Lentibacillus TaxID=175304 RepID=UPI0022B11CAA|nr:hypothetical protein [Lentibacillus daqui]
MPLVDIFTFAIDISRFLVDKSHCQGDILTLFDIPIPGLILQVPQSTHIIAHSI